MNMKPTGIEIRRRFPRLTMSLVMAIIFWIVSVFVPPTMGDSVIPGLDLKASFLIRMITMIIAALFLIRALSDALILGDIVTDIFVKRLGIKQEVSPKRAFRDFIYIIIVILVAAAVSPILSEVDNFGSILRNITTYVALGIILILIYDIGRILYRIIEQRAESVADRLAKMAEKTEENK
jgi:cation transport ATPase